MTGTLRTDAFAALLGIEVTRRGGGHAEARAIVTDQYLNPHASTPCRRLGLAAAAGVPAA